MNDVPPASPAPDAPQTTLRSRWRRLGFNFLTTSILVHVFFAVGAGYLIVQTIRPKSKATFTAASAPSAPAAASREHKVQMQKKQQTMSAPAQMKRVTTTAVNTKVALPQMPALPTLATSLSPNALAGMAGNGAGLSMGGGGAGGGGGGGGLNLFGLRTSTKGLKGTFYDLKQTRNKTPSSIKDIGAFIHQVDRFLQGGWNEGQLSPYYQAPTPLYATQIFVPHIASVEAPKAFGVEKEVTPALWMALYKGQISPPESGTYSFVGGGDNILIVRLNGRIVLDKSWNYQQLYGIDKAWRPTAAYDYHFGSIPGGFSRGLPIEMTAGEFYDMEILLGDDGGAAFFSLLVEKQGVEYMKTKGLPILPIFRVAQDPPPAGDQPPFQASGPVWSSRQPLTPAP